MIFGRAACNVVQVLAAPRLPLNLIGQRHDLRKAVCLCPILRSRRREPLGAQGSQLPLAVGRKLSVPGADSAWRDAHDGRQIRNGSCAQDRLVFRHF
jgi:hypothetical protein